MEWRAEVGRCVFVSRLRHAMERHARERGGASASGRDKGRAWRDGRAAAAGVTVKCQRKRWRAVRGGGDKSDEGMAAARDAQRERPGRARRGSAFCGRGDGRAAHNGRGGGGRVTMRVNEWSGARRWGDVGL